VYDAEVKLLIDERVSLGGKELFLSFESEDRLFSMLRLRLPSRQLRSQAGGPDAGEKILFEELKDAAIIREVHTYGQVKELSSLRGAEDDAAIQIGDGSPPTLFPNSGASSEIRNDGGGEKTQHRGLGKRLMAKAEEIAKERGYKKMAVISAIGTREYYAKLGYRLEGEYMVKEL
jgi:elongator complex protein 3